MLMVGQKAPQFSAEAVVGKGDFARISLSDHLGKWVVLFFYPQDFTQVCPIELDAFSRKESEFSRLKTVVMGCSVDSKHSHKAWIASSLGELTFPLLSDPTHQIARTYQALVEEKGHAIRATFIIDPQGVLQYALYQNEWVPRSVPDTLRVLEALQNSASGGVDYTRD
ncbi:MAG: peroxiredoxin [Myxococcota bacterium]|nr:peroxiredoxin [Myxococcota bacterium]